MWILIILALAGDYHGGNAVAVAEFSSKDRCEAAADAYIRQALVARQSGAVTPATVCSPK